MMAMTEEAMEVKAREALRSARSSSSPPGSRSVRRTQQSQLVTIHRGPY